MENTLQIKDAIKHAIISFCKDNNFSTSLFMYHYEVQVVFKDWIEKEFGINVDLEDYPTPSGNSLTYPVYHSHKCDEELVMFKLTFG